MPTLAEFNALPDAVAVLLPVCASTTWAEAVAAGRPYADLDALLAAADAAPVDLADALAGHPRIGDRVHGGSSAKEQAGMATASDAVRAAMAEGNAEYERRFGHVYLVCASGRSADDLLAVLRERLQNSAQEEAARTRHELTAINRLRLTGLIVQDR
ncbi:2-oxo-4-hydroxy-4-carboxy-5-ureidoimidazoline decarboxylase [Pseudonocardia oroxyli]|uniref:2-oxo-4-hydroxy-4-carboxy-5-ureidoimidazoline decarboxylase n=1 Tax=Pseudonocardia oroxyli TaxID=366584 RepID=A0A1G7URS5_PSEOR|nr:2-oxo-4-hydroxy-4-carboxy-5-ureidoimidazoline decarboxylase [Pseudonocardia oroxyli]SDG50325.1 2-oxo-4-hydroxy-4-carboxy-5-ureidoimidazoline decarboxylase [Pseudonocardia oroxyli]